jgi:hypothetical protein
MAILPKAIYMFNTINIKQSILKYMWKHKKTSKSQINSDPKSNAGGITIYDLKVCYRAIIIKKSMVLAQKQSSRPE